MLVPCRDLSKQMKATEYTNMKEIAKLIVIRNKDIRADSVFFPFGL